jgi:hypothetical protein
VTFPTPSIVDRARKFKNRGRGAGRLAVEGLPKKELVMTVQADLGAIVFDCANPADLAAFYRAATGWNETYSDDEYVYLGNGGPVQLAFQRIEGYESPGWPNPAKHAHLDLKVADLVQAEKELVAAGATRPDFQPGDGKWVVLLDPEGHPFCIAPAE